MGCARKQGGWPVAHLADKVRCSRDLRRLSYTGRRVGGISFVQGSFAFSRVIDVEDLLADVSEFFAANGVVVSPAVGADFRHTTDIFRKHVLKATPLDFV